MSGVLSGVLISLGCCVVLPITIVSLAIRNKMHQANKRTEIILAALEKNPNVNVEEIMRSMSTTGKSVKERLFGRLTAGLISLAVGLGTLTFMGIMILETGWRDKMGLAVLGGSITLAIGIAYIIAYLMGKRMFSKELEAENQGALKN